MGMAASQARFLSITARLSDNENSAQDITYSKIRLADETEQVNKNYLEALKATKLTVLTGFNGLEEVYTDISYGLMTGYNKVACGQQYVVTDNKGKILVTAKQKDAYESGNGSLNSFLAKLGYSQADIDITKNSGTEEDKARTEQKIHEAWDRYLTSVGLHYGDEEHGLDFGFTPFPKKDNPDVYSTDYFDGYPTYTLNGETKALNYEGTTQEQRELYEYATSLTEAYYGNSGSAEGLKTAAKADNVGYIAYLTNIYNKMQSSGYYVEKDETKTIKDNAWFEEELRKGNLQLEFFSATEKKFISTSYDSDASIQEVEDERAIAIAEREYEMAIEDLERKDTKFDMELKKLDTEHNALQTEYDSVKNVIDKNVEKSFQVFS